jgi:hypothetical protein
MAETSAFPVFIRAEYDSSGNAFRAFEKDATTAADSVRRRFTATFDEIHQVVSKAISRGVGASGSINLDTSGMRQAVADARLAEAAFDELTRTAAQLAVETHDTSQATRHYIQALSAQRIEAAQTVSQREADLATHSRLQAALDVTADKQSKLAQAYRDTYAEAARAAQIEITQSLANSRIGGTIAPAMNSRAIDNGAGYEALSRAAAAADQYQQELAELRQQLDPLGAEQARLNQQLEFAAEAFKRGDITAAQFQARSAQLNGSLDQVQGGSRAAAAGMQNLSYQIQDIFQGIALGVNPFTILAQQGGQLASSLQQIFEASQPVSGAVAGAAASMTGLNTATSSAKASTIQLAGADVAAVPAVAGLSTAAGAQSTTLAGVTITMRGATAATQQFTLAQKIGALAAGPLGAAMIALVSVAGTFAWSMRDSADATTDAKLASDSLGEAQSALGQMFDLTTGKIKAQNELLRLNVELTAIQLRANALAAEKIAQNAEDASGQRSWSGWFGAKRPGSLMQSHDTVARRKLQGVMRGQVDASEVAKWAEKADFSGVNITQEDYLKALASVVEVRRNREIAGKIDESMENGELDKIFRQPGSKRKSRQGGDSQKAADALANSLTEANERAISLRGQFDRMPSDIDRSVNAVEDADQIIAQMENRLAGGKLTDAQREAAEATKKVAEEAKALAEAAPNRPMADALVAAEETLFAQQLILEGRINERDTLQDNLELARLIGATDLSQVGVLIKKRNISEQQLETFYAQQKSLRDQERMMERLNRAGYSVQEQLREIDGIRGSIEQAIAEAPGNVGAAVKNLVGNITDQFRQLSARQLTDRLFGDVFEELEVELQSLTPMGRATQAYVDGTGKATTALAAFTTQLEAATAAAAANDNLAIGSSMGAGLPIMSGPLQRAISEIVVTAPMWKTKPAAEASRSQSGLSAADLYQTTFTRLFERYLGKGAPLARDLGSILSGYLQAGPVGGAINGLSALLGEGSGIGRALKGLSQSLPQVAMIMEAQSAIGSLLGNDEIKNGGILNHLIGPFATAIFGSAKRGSASISGNADDFSVAVRGNTGKYRKASASAADSVIESIWDIADRLGGYVDPSRGNVSIGIRKGQYRVDPTGQGRTKAKNGVLDFGDDAEAAARAAMIDLINDGVIQGLRAGTQRLIQAGKDLDAQLQKALDFQSVFDRLKAHKDPVGAALDTLDKEFTRLKKIFAEAGATTAEYAELEELYGIERAAAIKEASERLTASLKSLYDDLTIGDNGKSLRDRLAAAQAAYDPLKARVAAGDRTAYDDFAQAAQALLDIQRQFSGSQNGYFDLLNEITALTKQRIDAETNIASIAANRDSPFTSTGQVSTDSTAVVGAIGQTNQILIDGFRALIAANSNGAALPTGFLTQRFGSA